MNQTREHVVIRNQRILHSTAVRDYLCGECGSGLVTRYLDSGWATVCARDASHPVDGFVHRMAWQAEEARLDLEADRAEMVFTHLPPELRAAIREEE